jgi:glycosyltransferase involved in cell wall biosynthesis
LIDITEVGRVEPKPPGIWHGHLDQPVAETRIEAREADIEGWVAGTVQRVIGVEARLSGEFLGRAPTGRPRPDLAHHAQFVPGVEECGFRLVVPLLGRTPEVEVEVSAVFADGPGPVFAWVNGRRTWMQSRGPERDLVSVVIASYDKAHYLPDAIESALAQTYPHTEIVVVDDGSHDNTIAVASRYSDVRLVTQENEGPSGARNAGIRHSNGDYLVFLDGDDRLAPDAVEIGIKLLQRHPAAAFTAGQYSYIDLEGRPLPSSEQPRVEGDAYEALLRTNVVGPPSNAMFRRAVFEHVRGFDPSREIVGCEDYELYLRVARDFPVDFHRNVVTHYRLHKGSLSGHSAMMLEHVLRVHAAQKAYVAGTKLYQAYEEGRALWQEYYELAGQEARWRSVGRRIAERTRAIRPTR